MSNNLESSLYSMLSNRDLRQRLQAHWEEIFKAFLAHSESYVLTDMSSADTQKRLDLNETSPLTQMNSPGSERINHPSHYGGDTVYEAIKVIEAWNLNFNLGNCVKYIARNGKKDVDTVEDLKKARWYLDREISNREKDNDSRRV